MTRKAMEGGEVRSPVSRSSLRGKVLIVESDPSLSRLMRRALSARGFPVGQIPDGKDCIERIRRGRPALVVLVVDMAAGQNGYVICSRLKRDSRLKSLPIILIGNPDGIARYRKLKPHADAYVARPLDVDLLVQLVGALIGFPEQPAADALEEEWLELTGRLSVDPDAPGPWGDPLVEEAGAAEIEEPSPEPATMRPTRRSAAAPSPPPQPANRSAAVSWSHADAAELRALRAKVAELQGALEDAYAPGVEVAAAEAPDDTGDEDDEGTVISRSPSLESATALKQGELAVFLVDLRRLASPESAAQPMVFSGLDEHWTTLHVNVELLSAEVDFGPSGSSGVLELRRNGDSIPARLFGRVLPGHAEVHLRALFTCGGRFCGEARRSFPVGGAVPAATHGVSVPPTQSAGGSFVVEQAITPPDLTVHILGMPGSSVLRWYLRLADRHAGDVMPGMPVSLREDISLDQGDWQQWSLSLLDDFANKKSGSHLRLVQGIGQALFNRTPALFKQAYFALREHLGADFSIQFVTDGPFIPWELMQPVDGRKRYPLLMMEHPMARWLAEYGGRPRGRLGQGEVVSVAPSYGSRAPQVQVLPAALEQSRALLATMKALGIPAREHKALTEEVFELLERHPRDVSLLHFAGHGVAEALKPEAARLLLDDADLLAAEVQREEVSLGLRSGTFVFFSACSVGLDGSRVLGSPAGWPQAFIHRGFRGFLAPISRIWEEEAALFTEAFLKEAFERREPVGHALRNVRRQLGEQHSSCLAFMYYGDVMARFQHGPRR